MPHSPFRLTKIIATLGPASRSPAVIRDLITAGVDVFRLNFSHGDPATHELDIRAIREISAELNQPVAILQDLCGPKIRVGVMPPAGVPLASGSLVTITTEPVTGTAERFHSQYAGLAHDVQPGARILLDDGALELTVEESRPPEVRCRVTRGGILKSHKGMNLPGVAIGTPAFTAKDQRDLAVGLAAGVDFVALSFVRRAAELREVREQIRAAGAAAQLIAKIEKPEALADLTAILQECDGIMVARGDLGVELSLPQVPATQKELIRRANDADKYVITATQMLDSMTQAALPTRAEVSDVANAIADGSDAVMLSGETAVGAHPATVVRMMDAIARETEAYLQSHRPAWDWRRLNPQQPVLDALGHAALQLVEQLDIRAVVCHTHTGGTAVFLSKSRPFAPIVALAHDAPVLRRMQLLWGVAPVLSGEFADPVAFRREALRVVQARQLAPAGSRILLVASATSGTSDSDRVEVVTVPAN